MTFEKEILPYVKIIDPLGGEPFIQKDTFRIMDLVAKVNPNCSWRFTTNGQWSFNDVIAKYMDKLNLLSFQYSVDAIDADVYSKIRKGGKIQRLLKNIQDNVEYRKRRIERMGEEGFYSIHSITVMMTKNWKQVPLIIRKMEELDVEPLFVRCKDPEQLKIENQPPELIEEVLEFFFKKIDQFQYIFRYVNWLISSLPSDRQTWYKKQLMVKLMMSKK
jgi:cyclic pyranopterin phosphate synthase